MIEDKLNKNFKQAIAKSFHFAKVTGSRQVMPLHILLALIKQKGTIANEILRNKSIEGKILNILQKNKSSQAIKKIPTLSLSSENILLRAIKTAYELQHPYVGTEHLFYALLSERNNELNQILSKSLNKKQMSSQIKARFKGTSRFPEIRDMFNFMPQDGLIEPNTMDMGASKSLLQYFSVDLTDPKNQGKFMPLIGREKEIAHLTQILCRKNKNNPLLLGEPGVGKTAIVEGLAQKITEGNVPEILLDKTIVSLDLGSLVAGTMYRGDFESRVKQILEEIKNSPNLILFIDEIHNITGAGSAHGSMDAANLFKPLLARGDLRCIGATTDQEYKKNFTKDAALARRFQPLQVNEPNAEETLQILKGLKECYEEFHQIRISSKAISTAIELSTHYVPHRFQPDKSLDLIDEACAMLKIKSKSSNEKIKKIKLVEKLIADLEKQKEQSILEENYHQAINIKSKILEARKKMAQIKDAKTSINDYPHLNDNHVKQILAQKLDIDLDKISLTGQSNLADINKRISNHIIGQDKAVEKVVQTLKRSYSGIKSEKKPLASFIFAGPSGVGKTYLTEILAKELFSGKNNLIRLDMSEFDQQFNVSKLIGAPAGYIGYQEENKFTDQVKKKPHSIILFDEMEKAHKNVYNLLLQILDNGQITDAAGQIVSFRHTIIIMTSNLGNTAKKDSIGFGSDKNQQDKNQVTTDIKKFFSAEFINRIDDILVFNSLDLQNLEKIATIQVDKLKSNIRTLGKDLNVHNLIYNYLAKNCLQLSPNARALIKLIEEKIAGPISERIILNPAQTKIEVTIKDNKININ